MPDVLKHRLTRFLRVAIGGPRLGRVMLALGLTLQGIVTPWGVTPAFANNPDSISIGVRPVSTAPPAAVADLSAAANPVIPGQVSLTWTAPQGNVGGYPIPNQPVASYTIQYATFSIDSLGGNTTSWWNLTASSNAVLQPPTYTPQSPGQPEAYTFSNLLEGVTYYFAIKSTSLGGVVSPIDTHASTPGQQAEAFTASLLVAPSSFMGVALSTSAIQWSWDPVAGATQYLVYSDPANTLLQTLSSPTTSWTETGLALNTLYTRKVSAANLGGSSPYSSTSAVYTWAAAPFNLTVSAPSPTSLALTWDAANNPPGTTFDLERSTDGVAFSTAALVTVANYVDNGLSPNTTYYYRVRALNGDGIPTTYSAIVLGLTPPAYVQPAPVVGLWGSYDNSLGQVLLRWHAVTRDVTGMPVSIDHYVVQRSNSLLGTPTQSVTVSPNSLAYTELTYGQVYYYQIFAVSTNGLTSAASDTLDSTPQVNRIVVAANDINSRVTIPSAIATELLMENNGLGDDLIIIPIHRPQDETATTIRSYQFLVQMAASGQAVTNFAFQQPAANVQVSYGLNFGSIGLGSAIAANLTGNANAQAIAQVIALYWFNGSDYIRLGGTVITSDQALSVATSNMGIYQIRAISAPSGFQLTQNSPYPRLITPNAPDNNRVFFFFSNPSGETVSGTIYDLRGARIRDLAVNAQSPTPNCLVWDGKSNNGSVVHSGVYLYRINAGKESVTGTVVVAR
jgi:hypothetical protein